MYSIHLVIHSANIYWILTVCRALQSAGDIAVKKLTRDSYHQRAFNMMGKTNWTVARACYRAWNTSVWQRLTCEHNLFTNMDLENFERGEHRLRRICVRNSPSSQKKYSQLSTSIDSTNHGLKIFGKKKNFQKFPKSKTWICHTWQVFA